MGNRMQGLEKISWREKLAYGIGDPAQNIVFTMCSTLLVFFYTDVIGMNAAVIGTIMLISRLFDGVSDVCMGFVLDKTKSKHGKARAWILWMTIPYALASIALFCVPSGSEMMRTIYIFITYNLLNTIIYTALALSFSTLSSTITRDQEDRAHLTILRTVFSPISALVVSSFTLVFVDKMGGGQMAWIKTVSIYAAIAVVLLFICFKNTKERVHVETERSQSVSMLTKLKVLFTNKYWWIVALTYIVLAVFQTVVGVDLVYYSKYILGNATIVGYFNAAYNLPLFFVPLLAIPVLKKTSKRNFALAGCIVAIVGTAIIWLAPVSITVMTVGSFVRGVGNAMYLAVCWALLADTVEYGQWKSGIRLEGMIFCACTAALKLGGGLTNAVMGFAMNACGFDGTQAVQPDSAVSFIRNLFLYGPAVTWAIIAVLLLAFTLEKIYPRIMKELAEREAKQTN